MKKRFPSCWRVLLISTDHQLTTLTFCRREQSGQIPFPSHIFNNQQDIFLFMVAYYYKCVTVFLTNQMSPFFMLCLCVVLGVFVPCDRSVLPVIAGLSCRFFLILVMVKAEVSVIVPRDWVCSLFVCLFDCVCGHATICVFSLWVWSWFYSRLSAAVFVPLDSRGCVPCGCVGGCRWGAAVSRSSVLPPSPPAQRRGGQTSSAVPTARVPGSIQPQLVVVGPDHPLPSSLFVTSC